MRALVKAKLTHFVRNESKNVIKSGLELTQFICQPRAEASDRNVEDAAESERKVKQELAAARRAAMMEKMKKAQSKFMNENQGWIGFINQISLKLVRTCN